MERFWTKVQRSDGCWEWTASRDSSGYGTFRHKNRTHSAHRFAYELLVGPIPDGLQLDHLCRVRHCVNPDHLEAVTKSENLKRGDWPNSRKTHCPEGHPYSGQNLYVNKQGGRMCVTCCRAATRRWRARRAA